MTARVAVIIGAGPAGLTAAAELLRRTDIRPVVLEADDTVGGISRTVVYKGNRIDIGGHRFFSKSDRVTAWWLDVLPLQALPSDEVSGFDYLAAPAAPPDPACTDRVMLARRRLSRIFFENRFYDYPVTLNAATIRNLGPVRIGRVALSYLGARLQPVRPEASLEDFLINRFGRELFATFFEDYTRKVWGVPCARIPAAWGRQRIKGLSVGKALGHALGQRVRASRSLSQKGVETSLIERFLYPKRGPGQMWEAVADRVVGRGGIIRFGSRVTGLSHRRGRITEVTVTDAAAGRTWRQRADYVFSSMPVKHLIPSLTPAAPAVVRAVARGLVYRDFITVGLLLRRLSPRAEAGRPGAGGTIRDNWIYIQDRGVALGRIQFFNNWSPYMVDDPTTVWLGLEYFCNKGDHLWRSTDDDLARLAASEVETLGLIERGDILDWTVIRMEKCYPAYFGTYDRFDVIRRFVDGFENLFPIGRNGMHRYNNQDHSMLTAMAAVDAIVAGTRDKSAIWSVNAEDAYHESGNVSRAGPSGIPPETGDNSLARRR